MGRWALRFGILITALGLVLGAVFAWAWAEYVKAGPLIRDVTVVIEPGSGVNAIAGQLKRAGIITDARIFRLGVRVEKLQARLRAGEFSFPAGTSMQGAADVLVNGKTVVRRLTVAEGLSTTEVLAQINATAGLTGLATADGAGGEGRLLPETYHFSFGDDRADLVKRMRADMDKALADLWPKRQEGLPLKTATEALILASIVEKETGVAAERPLVAAVFINRLNRGMRLQSDPTVAYGLTEGAGPLGRGLTRSDLKSETAYNTYVISGLPPGPIANPGRAALQAVLNPAETKALYFVADGTGGHAFARTLDEHNRNVRKWRKIERERKGR